MSALESGWPGARLDILANGLTFDVFGAGEGDRLALCLHGFPEHAIAWRHQVSLLTELGYRVWAPNQRGYGTTTRPSHVRDYDLEHLLADVAGLVDASGAREVTLLGHDWGAVVAWLFAIRRVRPLARLVIANVPHPGVFEATLRRSWRQWLRSWYVLFFTLPWLPEVLLGADGAARIERMVRRSCVDPERLAPALATYRTQAAQPGALRAMLAWYRAAARGGFARQVALGFPPLDVPTLVVWGERDVALGKETTYGTHRYVRDLRLCYLPGASHWVQQDAPERFNDLLRRFLTEPPPAKSVS